MASPDPSFGVNGIVTIPFGSSHDAAHALALQSDGKVVVAGWTQSQSDRDFAIARLNVNGSLDGGFGSGGKVITPIGTNNEANAVTIDNWGRIVVAGYMVSGGVGEAVVARYFANGSLDGSFNGTGMKAVPGYTANAIRTVGAGGSAQYIIVGGTSAQPGGDDFSLSRLENIGSYHTWFNGTGAVMTSTSSGYDRLQAMAIQSDGKIVVAGSTQVGSASRFLVIRYNGNGTLDATFNVTGKVSTTIGSNDHAKAIAIQADGKIIVVGSSRSGSRDNMAIVRYNTNGSLDTGFGVGGITTTDFFGGDDSANAVVIQSNGKILVGGTAGDTMVFAVARYHENGTLDLSLNGTGMTIVNNLGDGNHYANGLAILPDGRYILAGSATRNGANDFAVVRFLNNPPSLVNNPVTNLGKTSARVNCALSGNGGRTSIRVQYGTTQSFEAPATPDQVFEVANSAAVQVALSGLLPNRTYYYRFVATNGSGTTNGATGQFTTLPDGPTLGASPPVNVTPNSAMLTVSVNPNSRDTNVQFAYGLNPGYLDRLTPVQALSAGSAPVAVTAQLTGLYSNTVYYYRASASNSAGSDETSIEFFSTVQLPAEISATRAIALTTSSVILHGTVRGRNALTECWIDYSSDMNFAAGVHSVATDPIVVSGDETVEVRAVVSGLLQGNDYFFRVRTLNAGGQSLSTPLGFRTDVLSGFTRNHPGAPPASEGFLTVNLSPAGLLHGWRFLGEQEWRLSGVPATGLATGDREIEFRPVPGFLQPPAENVGIVSGAAATVLERFYYETEAGAGGTGGLSVTLKPDSLTSGPDRAQWRLLGEDDNAWRDSGATIAALLPGAYLIELKPVAGRATPPNASVLVVAGQTAAPTVTYFLPDATTGEVPSVLAFETVTAAGDGPFAHVGQLRSRSGAGTGFVVKPRVVATAAHVAWDDGTLTAAKGLQWMFQRHRGLHDPKPLQPRGFYIFKGYEDQRRLDNSPGDSSPESQTLDVAALYFNEDAARGGYGGFLASDLADNEFLLSNANKMLVGYPVDGIAPASRGRMHATAPFDVPFTPGFGHTFTTTAIRSFGGNSGGPLCVQFEGGAYFPAAVYLGGNAQTVVRAIDSEVVRLFNRAEDSGNGGGNNTGGGITGTEFEVIGGPGIPGSLQVDLRPATAIAGGGKWRLKPESSFRESGFQRAGLSPGRYVLELTPVAGFQTPALQSVQIRGGGLTTLTFTYAQPPVVGPEIVVRGRGRDLPDGDASPSALDGTDFGVVAVDPVPAVPPDPPAPDPTSTRTFTIFNTGNRALSLGTPAFSGDHAADFEVTTSPAASVAPGGSTSFTVSFDPSGPGVRTASLSLPNNDSNENPFNFALQGNDVADANSNGFSDVEEAALDALLATFTVGQRVDLDLSFLRLGEGHTLAVTGLPPGLVFNPATNRLTGTILAKPAPGHLLRKMDGSTELGSRAFDLRVFLPARLVVSTAPRRFAPTLVNRRSAAQFVRLSNSGELPLQRLAVRLGGTAPNDFLLPVRPPATLQPGASANVSVVFRPLGRGTRLGSLILTSSDAPKSVPLSGVGR